MDMPRSNNTVLVSEDNQVQAKDLAMSKRSDLQALSILLLFVSFCRYWLCNATRSVVFL